MALVPVRQALPRIFTRPFTRSDSNSCHHGTYSEFSNRIGQAISQAVWPIVARVNGEWQPSGTAFLVSPLGLMITAQHIIEPAAKKRGRKLSAAAMGD